MFPFASFGFLSYFGREMWAGDAKSATLPRADSASDFASVKKSHKSLVLIRIVIQRD